MTNPVVSIIVPTMNSEKRLRRCLDSVLNQSYPEIELIVIDGRSSDGTVDILKSYGDKLAYWESSPDTGVFQASNKGIKRASGDWIYCLGSDDYLWSPDVLEKLAPHLVRAYPAHTFIQAKVALMGTDDHFVRLMGEEPWAEMKQRPHTTWLFYSQGVFHHRDAYEQRGCFDETFKYTGDYDVNIREALKNGVVNIDLVTAAFSRGGLSTNPGTYFKKREELRRAWAKNNLPTVKEYSGGSYLMYGVYHLTRPFVGTNRAIDFAHNALEFARLIHLDRVFGSKARLFRQKKGTA